MAVVWNSLPLNAIAEPDQEVDVHHAPRRAKAAGASPYLRKKKGGQHQRNQSDDQRRVRSEAPNSARWVPLELLSGRDFGGVGKLAPLVWEQVVLISQRENLLRGARCRGEQTCS
jgi:hypothetical protein